MNIIEAEHVTKTYTIGDRQIPVLDDISLAVAEGEFFRLPALAVDKGVVGRHAAIIVQADHRPGVVVGPLGPLPLTAVAEGDVEIALAVEHQA